MPENFGTRMHGRQAKFLVPVADIRNQGRPALGMFEVFGQTKPPILGGRHFGFQKLCIN